jgi:hypothetical protein
LGVSSSSTTVVLVRLEVTEVRAIGFSTARSTVDRSQEQPMSRTDPNPAHALGGATCD